jgi:hypothetical protein
MWETIWGLVKYSVIRSFDLMKMPMPPSAPPKTRAPAIRNMAPKSKTVLRGTHNPANQLPPHAFHKGKRQTTKR